MFYDLSHPIENEMTVFPGDPEPRIAAWPSDPPWRVSTLQLGSHCGTHIDAPMHIGAAPAIDELPLTRLIGRAVVIDVSAKTAGQRIGREDLGQAEAALQQGLWAVFRSGWSRYWKSDAYLHHPSLDPALARLLVAWKVGLVAFDLLNPDATAQGEVVIHQILLGAGVLIVENLRGLEQLEANRQYTFSFLPLKVAGIDGAPVRAVAWDEPI